MNRIKNTFFIRKKVTTGPSSTQQSLESNIIQSDYELLFFWDGLNINILPLKKSPASE